MLTHFPRLPFRPRDLNAPRLEGRWEFSGSDKEGVSARQRQTWEFAAAKPSISPLPVPSFYFIPVSRCLDFPSLPFPPASRVTFSPPACNVAEGLRSSPAADHNRPPLLKSIFFLFFSSWCCEPAEESPVASDPVPASQPASMGDVVSSHLDEAKRGVIAGELRFVAGFFART